MGHHGSMNSRNNVHPSGGSVETLPMRHCGRCKNPYMSNPACECGCHKSAEVQLLEAIFVGGTDVG